MLQSFLALCFSHLLNDFTLQTDSFVERKKEQGRKGLVAIGIHSAIFMAVCITVLTRVKELTLFTGACILILAATHFLTDLAKVKLETAFSSSAISLKQDPCSSWILWIKTGSSKVINNKLGLFCLDQICHFAFMFLVLEMIYLKSIDEYIAFIRNFTVDKVTSSIVFSTESKLLLLGISIVLVTSFANVFIKVLDLKDDGAVNNGSYIGIAERILIIFGVISSQYEALAIMFAAKAAIRFTEAKKSKQVAEYFLIGSFISAAFGIIAGMLIKYLYF